VFRSYRLSPNSHPFGIVAGRGAQGEAGCREIRIRHKAAAAKDHDLQETTYVTEPLRADGYVDYVAALNRTLLRRRDASEQTPPSPSGRPWGRRRSTRRSASGTSSCSHCRASEEGPYLVRSIKFFPQHIDGELPNGGDSENTARSDDAQKQFDRSQRSPWSKGDFPAVAALLEKNDKALRVVIDGVQRPRFYSPVVTVDGDSLANMELILGLSESREVLRQLTSRAMLRLGSGSIDGAWQDVMAGHRFARLLGQRPCSSIGWWPSGWRTRFAYRRSLWLNSQLSPQAGPRVPIAVAGLASHALQEGGNGPWRTRVLSRLPDGPCGQ